MLPDDRFERVGGASVLGLLGLLFVVLGARAGSAPAPA